MSDPVNTDSLSRDELKALVEELLSRVSALGQTVIEQREEIARLKGLKGRPDIKPPSQPSGMEKANRPQSPAGQPRRGGGPRRPIARSTKTGSSRSRTCRGSRCSRAIRTTSYRNWCFASTWCAIGANVGLTPDGRELVAEMPAGVTGHFGAELRPFRARPASSGAGHHTPLAHPMARDRDRNLQAATHAPADRRP